MLYLFLTDFNPTPFFYSQNRGYHCNELKKHFKLCHLTDQKDQQSV